MSIAVTSECSPASFPSAKSKSVSELRVDPGNPVPEPDFPQLYDGLRFGDLDNDGKVNLSDFSILSSKFGTSEKKADINRDGRVDSADFSIMSGYFGMNVSGRNTSETNKDFGDFNGDYKVDLSDFALLASKFGGKDTAFDINGDSQVDHSDFNIMRGYFGRDISSLLGVCHMPVRDDGSGELTPVESPIALNGKAQEMKVEAEVSKVPVDTKFHVRTISKAVSHDRHEKESGTLFEGVLAGRSRNVGTLAKARLQDSFLDV